MGGGGGGSGSRGCLKCAVLTNDICLRCVAVGGVGSVSMCFFAPYLFSFGCTLPSEGIPREDKTSEKEKSAGKDSGKDKDGVSLPPIASGSTASTPAANGEGESEQAGACILLQVGTFANYGPPPLLKGA